MIIDIRQYQKDQSMRRRAGNEMSDVDGRFKMYDIDSIHNENSVRKESALYKTFIENGQNDTSDLPSVWW